MRILSYLLIAVFLLAGCTSVYGQDATPKPTQKQVRENIRKAEQGDAEAQSVLGLMYTLGLGVPQDKHESVKWYRRAAEQGYAHGQFSLGVMYYFGEGVPKDHVLAYKWFNLAAAQGDKDAAKARDELATFMTPFQIQEAQNLARNFKPKKEKP